MRRLLPCADARHDALFALLCLGCLYLAFAGLEDYALWVDEAETGFVAKGVLSGGLPYAHDGDQPYPGPSRYYNERFLWMETPWIQFYVTALSFKLLGVGVFSARLPFVVIGLLTVALSYRLAQRLFDTSIARATALLLLTSAPYLLHIRQCRYFALLAFGTVWGVWAYTRFVRGERFALPHLTGAAVFLFYSHYAYFFAFMSGVSVCLLLFYRPFAWKRVLTMMGCIFILTFPWALYADLFGRRDAYGGWSYWNLLANLGYYTHQLHVYVAPILSLPAVALAFNRSGLRRAEYFVFAVIPFIWMIYMLLPAVTYTIPEMGRLQIVLGAALFVMSVVWGFRSWSAAALPRDEGRFLIAFIAGAVVGIAVVIPNNAFRYIIGFIPLVYMLIAVLIVKWWRRSVWLGGLGALGLAGVNAVAVLPFALLHWMPFGLQDTERALATPAVLAFIARVTGWETFEIRPKLKPNLEEMDRIVAQTAELRAPLFDYTYQLMYPYRGPVEAVIQYLQAHASPDDTFSTDADAVILAFHTGLRPEPISIASEKLTADWVSIRPHRYYAAHPGRQVRRFYERALTPWYEKITLDAPDLPNINYHLPDPNVHMFRIDEKAYGRMVLFRRKIEYER